MSGIPAGAGALLGKRLGKYEILALLALGGTAEIYLARIDGTNGFEKYVVVKCLHDHLVDDPDFVKMFLDEARLAALLDHSNIVQTFELGEHENRYYMVMEFLAGLSLAMVVRRAAERLPGGRLPVQLALNAAAQACAGLHYAHERTNSGRVLSIVHRDMSPQNLVVSFEGVVKVVDFGIAKAEMRETRTRAGTIKGKFAYMSPEQCVANNVDRRTDVFALGVILHELLTGRRLFKRPSPYDTYQAVIECNVAPPSQLNHELDPTLDPIVMRALAKDKDKRYDTAEAFGDALLGYLHHRGKGSGAGEISRFFDTHFTQELEEHATRMRELIAGRELAVDTGASWDEEIDGKVAQAVAEAGPAGSAGQANDGAGGSAMDVKAGEIGGPRGGHAGQGGGQDGDPLGDQGVETNRVPRIDPREARLDSAGGATVAGEVVTDTAGPSLAMGEIELPGGARPSGLTGILSDLDDGGDRTRIEENPLEIAPTLQPGALNVSDIGDWVGDLSSNSEAQPLPASAAAAGRASSGRPSAERPRLHEAEAPTQIAPAVEVSRPPLGGPAAGGGSSADGGPGGPGGPGPGGMLEPLGPNGATIVPGAMMAPPMAQMGGPNSKTMVPGAMMAPPPGMGPSGPMGPGGMGPGGMGMGPNGPMGPGGMGPGGMGPGGMGMGPNGPMGPGGMGPGGMGPGGMGMGPNGPVGPGGMGMGPNGPMGPGGPHGMMGPGGPHGMMGPNGPGGMGPGGMGMGPNGPNGPGGMGPNGPMGPGGMGQYPGGPPRGQGPYMAAGTGPAWGGLAPRKLSQAPWWVLTLVFMVVVGLALGLTMAIARVL